MTGSDAKSLSEGDFMRLFVRHEPALRAYARSILHDWEAVDDALQEASVTMWEKLAQLGDESGFLPWAKVILRFKCLAAITGILQAEQGIGGKQCELVCRLGQKIVDQRHVQQTVDQGVACYGDQVVGAPGA